MQARDEEMDPMKMACGYTVPIALCGIPPGPENHLKAMEIVGRAGFEAIELELHDTLIPEHQRDVGKMKAILREYGTTCPSVMAVEEGMFSLDPVLKAIALQDFDYLTDLIAGPDQVKGLKS